MRCSRSICALAASLALAFLVTGCQTAAPASDASAAGPAGTGPSPVNERSERERAEWEAAIAGLGFDTGRVVVDAPPSRSDEARAARLMEAGDTELASNHRTQAVAAYAAAVRAAPDLPEAHIALGEAMIAKGKTDLALACYRTALDLRPDDTETRFALAETLAREMRFEEAIDEMEAVVAAVPGHGRAHERLAIWQYYGEDYGAAWRHVRAARAAGHEMPPQFITLLSGKMAESDVR
ncbi:MAG: tetratricopeptide repeat protein [Planctomycetota bacterium]|nr:tetratricopeptide repeat protein [Planctomycetota bacterium]